MADSVVAWAICEAPGKRNKIYSCARACLLKPIQYDGMPCSFLMQWRGAWSCLNLMYQTLLTSYGIPSLMGGVDRGMGGGAGARGRILNEMLNEIKKKSEMEPIGRISLEYSSIFYGIYKC